MSTFQDNSISVFLNTETFKYVDSNLEPLISEKQQRLEQFICLCENSNVVPVYRGEKRFLKIYQVEDENLVSLSRKVFMVGNKANVFLNKEDDSYSVLSEKVFNRLYRDIKKVLKHSVNKEIKEFCNRKENLDFVHFFNSTEKSTLWYKVIDLSPEEQEAVLDYYLSFLHTTGKYILKDKSPLLSTSRSFQVAVKFAQDGIVFLSWIKRQNKNTHQIINEHNSGFLRIGLPTYGYSLFPEQEEVCIKYGLVPQYIWGIYHIPSKRIIVNPALFESVHLEKVLDYGFIIDQAAFQQTLYSTLYKRFFYSINNKYCWLR